MENKKDLKKLFTILNYNPEQIEIEEGYDYKNDCIEVRISLKSSHNVDCKNINQRKKKK